MNILLGFKELPTEDIRFTSLGRFKATFVRGISCVVEHGSLVRTPSGEYTPYDELGYLKSNACFTSWWNSESAEGIIASKRIWHAEHDMQQQHSERWLKIKDSLKPHFFRLPNSIRGHESGCMRCEQHGVLDLVGVQVLRRLLRLDGLRRIGNDGRRGNVQASWSCLVGRSTAGLNRSCYGEPW